MRFAAEMWVSANNWAGDYQLAALAIDSFEEPRELLPTPTIDELEKMLNSDEPLRIQIRPDGSIWTGPSELMQTVSAMIRALKNAAGKTTALSKVAEKCACIAEECIGGAGLSAAIARIRSYAKELQ